MKPSDSRVLRDATVIDCTGGAPFEGDVVIEGGRIAHISRRPGRYGNGSAGTIDCRGRSVLPGLIDAHVHAGAVQADIPRQHREVPTSLVALQMAARLGQMLDAGYTTVRDAGGADAGFRTAVQSGLIRGPRVFVSGRPLTQTGGHGDVRTPAESVLTTGERIDQTKVVVDGQDAVVRAVREEFRRGADQIKMMASGGVLSASDPLAPPQFSLDELSVAVAEARRRGSYVLAHAYSDEAIGQCADAGVRSIEHGNFLTPATAARMREADMFLVPTLLAYELLWEHSRTTLGAAELDKLQIVRATGLRAVKVAAEAGVKVASGSDVMGPHLSQMARELQLKTEALGSMGTLVATTRTNAELLRVENEVGRLSEGLIADVLVVDGDPITDIALLGDRSRIHAVFRSGVLAAGQLWCRDRPEALLESAAQL